MSGSLMSNYARLPVTFVRGEGAWLWDQSGKRYLDALAGIAVCGLGHAHPAVTTAICEQAHQLIHTSNLYGIAHQQALAEALVRVSGMETAFFCNSGAEANEAAIKIARLYGHQQGIEQPTIIVTEGSFHGRTLATLTATGNLKIQAGFAPLLPGFIRVPYNDVAAISQIAATHPEVVAILVEPVTGEGGIAIPEADYLIKLKQLCQQHHWLLMLDEIQTGMGRTGQWFAYQAADIVPDVLTLAKALGNGVPIGACLANGEAATLFQPGSHGSTYGGNPLVCRAALAVIETIETENLVSRAHELGQYFYQGFSTTLADIVGVRDIRVKGLMIGIELDQPCSQLMNQALDKQLLINVTAQRVIRLLPPLIISDTQADEIINTVSQLVREFYRSPAKH
jgi:acetylornithine/N-succinyldiaminopimelate aminotransferase